MQMLQPPKRKISKTIRYQILLDQKWKCAICGKLLKFSKNHIIKNAEVAHIDHIHRYSDYENYHNGTHKINERENLRALCPQCNLKRG